MPNLSSTIITSSQKRPPPSTMRLDSNLSAPRNNSKRKTATKRGAIEKEMPRESSYLYDRWTAPRNKYAQRFAGETRAGAKEVAVPPNANASSPPRESALLACYANSLDFAELFCLAAVDRDGEDEHENNSEVDDEMHTLARVLAARSFYWA